MKQKLMNVLHQNLAALLFLILIVNLFLYIFSLNIAIWESFQREKIQKQMKLLRQELQSREEFFISRLTYFYETHAADIRQSAAAGARFTARRGSVARARENFLR